jgi:aminomethyltransferase
MVTRDVMKCKVGQVLYTPWCDIHGKIIDDGTISRLDQDTFRLTSAEPNVRWLTLNAVGLDVTMEDVSARTGALALQGPLSRAILEQVSPADFSRLKYFRLIHTTLRDIPVTIARTGYTGDLGTKSGSSGAGPAVWDALIEATWIRHRAGRHLGAGSGPDRGGPPDDRGGLRQRAPRTHRGAEVVAL